MREIVGRSVRCSKSTSNGSQQRLDEVRDRTVALDRRTGTTTTGLWPAGSGPAVEHTQDIDDWR